MYYGKGLYFYHDESATMNNLTNETKNDLQMKSDHFLFGKIWNEKNSEFSFLMKDYKIFKLVTHEDDRGFFLENYSKIINQRLGLEFKQDNLSFSRAGVVRGLHYQWDKPMGKLVSVIKGSIIDYIVDIRVGSPTFGQAHSI